MTRSDHMTGQGDGDRPGTSEDPVAAMRLRAAPPRVTRLSRKMLIGLGAVVLLGIGGALVYALQTKRPAHRSPELYDTGHATTSDEVQALPQDYTHVPKLGPPLPGDLGRPILESGGVPAAGPVIAAETPDARRRQQEIEAARVSKLFAQTRSQSHAMATPAPMPVPAAQPSLAALGLAPQATAQSQQDRQRAFLDAPTGRETVSPDRVQPPASPDILQAGTVIPAALITGIRSDLPGPIIAQVTENVFDSPTGRILLVPQGTRLIGSYDNGVGFGQSRVLLVWTRMIFPNGSSIILERQPGADAQGYAGLTKLSHHAPPRDRSGRDRREAFPEHVDHDVEDAEQSAKGKLVVVTVELLAAVRGDLTA